MKKKKKKRNRNKNKMATTPATRTFKPGELLVVEDYSKLNADLRDGRISQEDYDAIFTDARVHGLMNTPVGKLFGKIYPFAMGGSDTGAVEGCSEFTSKKVLQLKKLSLIESVTPPSLQFIYDFGHIFEDAVGYMGALQLRARGIDVVYVPCDFGYVKTDWRHFLVHPDGFLVSPKTGKVVALAEIKTTRTTSPHWINSFAHDKVPEEYMTQVQAYMQVLGIDTCYVLAWNCERDADGFKQLRVDRDESFARKILDDCEQFVKDTEAGVMYNTDVLPSEAAMVYKEVDETKDHVKLSVTDPKISGIFSELDRIAEEKAAIKAEAAESQRALYSLEKEEKTLKSGLFDSIGNAPGGIFETEYATYRVDVTRGFSFDADVKKMTQERYPEAWEEITRFKPTISAKVVKTDKRPTETA